MEDEKILDHFDKLTTQMMKVLESVENVTQSIHHNSKGVSALTKHVKLIEARLDTIEGKEIPTGEPPYYVG